MVGWDALATLYDWTMKHLTYLACWWIIWASHSNWASFSMTEEMVLKRVLRFESLILFVSRSILALATNFGYSGWSHLLTWESALVCFCILGLLKLCTKCLLFFSWTHFLVRINLLQAFTELLNLNNWFNWFHPYKVSLQVINQFFCLVSETEIEHGAALR